LGSCLIDYSEILRKRVYHEQKNENMLDVHEITTIFCVKNSGPYICIYVCK